MLPVNKNQLSSIYHSHHHVVVAPRCCRIRYQLNLHKFDYKDYKHKNWMWNMWDSRKENKKAMEKFIIGNRWAKVKSRKRNETEERETFCLYGHLHVCTRGSVEGEQSFNITPSWMVGFYVNSIYTPYTRFHIYRYTHSTDLSVCMCDMPAHITCRATHTCTRSRAHIRRDNEQCWCDMYAIRMKSERAQFSASALQRITNERKRECMWREDRMRERERARQRDRDRALSTQYTLRDWWRIRKGEEVAASYTIYWIVSCAKSERARAAATATAVVVKK